MPWFAIKHISLKWVEAQDGCSLRRHSRGSRRRDIPVPAALARRPASHPTPCRLRSAVGLTGHFRTLEFNSSVRDDATLTALILAATSPPELSRIESSDPENAPSGRRPNAGVVEGGTRQEPSEQRWGRDAPSARPPERRRSEGTRSAAECLELGRAFFGDFFWRLQKSYPP